MQIYWNAYNSPNGSDKDDYEATCYKAIGCCLDRGATKSELLKLIDNGQIRGTANENHSNIHRHRASQRWRALYCR